MSSMKEVADLAGVSTSTVSRVINNHPSISPKTVQTVREAMETLKFKPTIRKPAAETKGAAPLSVAYLVFEDSARTFTPAFEQLLGGISKAADDMRVNFSFSFASDLAHIPQRVLDGDVDGLLLGGVCNNAEIQRRLARLPAVWLMGNRQRPQWGHQVMPDNTAIGQIAARYLIDRGHKDLVSIVGTNSGWSLQFRAMAFEAAARDRGATVHTRKADDAGSDPYSGNLADAATRFLGQVMNLNPRPTGVFISEDRLVTAVDAALVELGIDPDAGSMDVISCNNERKYLAGIRMKPATIDINAASIGRYGLQLLTRIIRNELSDVRTRWMIGPRLVAE